MCRPGPGWLRRGYRKRMTAAEAAIREDAEEWARYQTLGKELWAWNAVQSGVALIAVAALVAAVAGLAD